MSLRLYYHPLSSFCQKVLIALYENDTPFERELIDFGNPESAAKLFAIWPIGKFPVLEETATNHVVPESSIIIEYLDQHHPGPMRFLPDEPDAARQTRMRDRFYDLNVNVPMQKIVTDRLRPQGQGDAHGVAHAKSQLQTALGMVEKDMAAKSFAMGDRITMADCAAAPALYYADMVLPLTEAYPHAARYLQRLSERASFARVIAEAEPYRKFFPKA